MTSKIKSRIRRSDEVVVLTGRDKGRRGEVLRVLPDGRCVVAGVNMVKKHRKPNPALQQPGGIIEMEAPIQISNVAIWNAEAGRGDRIGYAFGEDGKKFRIFKSTGKPVDA